MARAILLTGGDGFVGRALRAQLGKGGWEVHGREFELCDDAAVRAAVGAREWDAVVHLAGMSSVAGCEKDPERARAVNVEGTRRLAEAVVRAGGARRFVFASTAQVYRVDGERPLDESAPIAPQNLYARTKLEAEGILSEVSARTGFPLTVCRFFNHTGRAQPPVALMPSIWKRLGEARESGAREIPVGNLDLWRDIGHVDDLVAALAAILDRAPARATEVFNVCTGKGKNLRRVSELLAREAGVSEIRFTVDPALLRPGEPRSVVGSCAALSAATGWRPGCQSEEELVRRFVG